MATTVPFTLNAGAPASAAFAVAAGTANTNIQGLEGAKATAVLERSLDGGTTWAPVGNPATGLPIVFSLSTSFDITEVAGNSYRWRLQTYNTAGANVTGAFRQ